MRTSDTRICQVCKEIVTLGQPDPCLGYLPDVAHACCGHGKTVYAYCCGFEGCKPSESIMSHGKYRKGYWIKRGREALEHMYLLKRK